MLCESHGRPVVFDSSQPAAVRKDNPVVTKNQRWRRSWAKMGSMYKPKMNFFRVKRDESESLDFRTNRSCYCSIQ